MSQTVPKYLQPPLEDGCSKHHEEYHICSKEPRKIQLSENKAGAAQVKNEQVLVRTIGKLNVEHKCELQKIQEDIINLK